MLVRIDTFGHQPNGVAGIVFTYQKGMGFVCTLQVQPGTTDSLALVTSGTRFETDVMNDYNVLITPLLEVE